MLKLLFFFLGFQSLAMAYVPTVESLFRHGSNQDITSNGLSITFVVRRMDVTNGDEEGSSSLVTEGKKEDFYKIFFSKFKDVVKVSQTRYANGTYSESSFLEKRYYPNFTSHTIPASPEEAEKGLFHGLLRSIALNDGTFLIGYLKALGVPVKRNSEIINRAKVEFLTEYKRYLVVINKDKTAKRNTVNPLHPDDPVARERAERLMQESIYLDQKQVKLAREEGDISWLVTTDNFEAVITYEKRRIQKIKYRSHLGEFEIECRDYWLANGTHALPKYMQIKNFKGEIFQVEITNLRHYNEREDDLINRLKKWDELLKGKLSHEIKPSFLL